MVRLATIALLVAACCLRQSDATPTPSAAPDRVSAAPATFQTEIGTAIVGGVASWTDGETAAGPLLRELIGPGWRGSWVTIRYREATVRVQLTDWCQCYRGEPRERIVDLNRSAFAALRDPSVGLVDVQVEIP